MGDPTFSNLMYFSGDVRNYNFAFPLMTKKVPAIWKELKFSKKGTAYI
jgi:hypothetical protein